MKKVSVGCKNSRHAELPLGMDRVREVSVGCKNSRHAELSL